MKIRSEIETVAKKNFDTMSKDVRREADESINKILLSHDQVLKTKRTYADTTNIPSFEFP